MSWRNILTFAFIINALSSFAQIEWEDAVAKGLAWKVDPSLTTYSTELSGLRTYNYTKESSDAKKNHTVDYLSAYLNQHISFDRPCEIKFTVKNTNDNIKGPQMHVTKTKKNVKGGRIVANIFQSLLLFPFGLISWWWNPVRETVQEGYYDDSPSQVYWGYTIKIKSTEGISTTYRQRFCHSINHNLDEWNSDSETWKHYEYGTGTIYLKLEYTRNKSLKLYSSDKLVKIFSNVAEILYLGLDAGCNAKLEVSNFSMQRMTLYGVAKPMIESAVAQMQQENWYEASKILRDVMDNIGYKDFKTYYLKGYCELSQNHTRTAIDLFTNAINSTSASIKDREAAYFLRGYCKAVLEDLDCVNDMRKAGEDGRTWLREMQLENYDSSQSTQQTVSKPNQSTNRPKSWRMAKKPLLKK